MMKCSSSTNISSSELSSHASRSCLHIETKQAFQTTLAANLLYLSVVVHFLGQILMQYDGTKNGSYLIGSSGER
jgi:hypothetical protein